MTAAAPRMPTLALIAAVAANGVIGAQNTLPWKLSADLKHFRALTTGHAVIMGRKTWESLPRALPERQNIVVSRLADFAGHGAEHAASLEAALALVQKPGTVFCIGGGDLYRAAMPRADVLYITEIDRAFEGDVSFPPIDRAVWRETAREAHVAPEGSAFAFVTYERLRLPTHAATIQQEH